MTVENIEDWADQYLHQLTKQSSWRSDMLQRLISAQDWQACREFIDEWEEEDKNPGSIAQKYQRAVNYLRQFRQANAVGVDGSSVGLVVCFPGSISID